MILDGGCNENFKTYKGFTEEHIGEPAGKTEALNQCIDLMAKSGKIADVEKYRKGVFAREDEYELTEQSRNHAEREFRKKGDQIVWDASRRCVLRKEL